MSNGQVNPTTQDGTILVRPVLFCAPVFWTPEFWSASAHAWDWVRAETPLEQKPWAELEVSLGVTLGETFEVACDAWGIELGADNEEWQAEEHRNARRYQFHRFAFVRTEQDAAGVSEQVGYRWPSELPIPREDGRVERVFGLDVTYRELLVASSLGLIEGDVTRPYVHPVAPQGDLGFITDQLVKLTAEAIRAAYEALDDAGGYVEQTIRLIRASAPEAHRVAGEAVDDAVRLAAVYAFYRWIRRKLRRQDND